MTLSQSLGPGSAGRMLRALARHPDAAGDAFRMGLKSTRTGCLWLPGRALPSEIKPDLFGGKHWG